MKISRRCVEHIYPIEGINISEDNLACCLRLHVYNVNCLAD